MNKTPRFVLASASPRRKVLLHEAGYLFDIQPSRVPEPPTDTFDDPAAYAIHTAWRKANDVAEPNGPWVVGADTVVTDGRSIIGKAEDRAHAEQILRSLAGTQHKVITGVCLVLPKQGVSLVDSVSTDVAMKSLSDEEVIQLLDSGSWEGKAGAYGIQDKGDPLVTVVSGSISNVVGLPMERLAELFEMAIAIGEASMPSES